MNALPRTWARISLSEIRIDSPQTIDPRQEPSEVFELFSVPAHADGQAELAVGAAVGSTKQTVVPGTVLVCKINPRINRVWVVGQSRGKRQIASTEWIPFSPCCGVDPRYLAHQLRRDQFRNHLAQNVSGVGGSLM